MVDVSSFAFVKLVWDLLSRSGMSCRGFYFSIGNVDKDIKSCMRCECARYA